ncbi:MAG: pyruvate dehydrogenase (acetyl-transferring), homodimeric type, partial [Acidimicrobiales bacterium]|nr:pyruvate dehydrogenase (acetyl-transferring), homodimeric type [Acidimicrobiales bacterium]
RRALAGPLPKRVVHAGSLPIPETASGYGELLVGSGRQAVSTTMAFARLLRTLVRDPGIGARIVPIIPDEARTFGLDALFKEVKIYAPSGQLYTPVDAGLLLSYSEAENGQILEEGITEAGSMASLIAAGTSYATWSEPMIPFFIFYSMFGFQRVGDLAWAAGDIRARGFMLGATAGRTTLNGEGLQHEDGQSQLLATTYPNVSAYDPAFAYEVATIIEEGIRRMCGPSPEDRIFYLTLYNENYVMPPLPEGEEGERVREGIRRGLYRFAGPPEDEPPASPRPGTEREDGQLPRRATLLFSGPAWLAAMEARRMLAEDWGVAAEAWSVTSYQALRDDALGVERWNRLHPTEPPRTPHVTEALSAAEGPVVAVTDYMKAVPEQVARWIPAHFTPLGTDGFGRSDTRAALRRHFEVDAAHVVVAVLAALAATGEGKTEDVADAIARYGIDPEATDPKTA